MPQDVRKEITVNELRKGDQIVAIAGEPFESSVGVSVTDVAKKQTYAYVTRTGRDNPLRIHLATPITVLRSEPTDEEKAASLNEARNHMLYRMLAKALERDPATVAQEFIDKYRASENADELFSWSTLPDVLRAQALYKQAVIIRRRLHDLGGFVRADVDPETLLDAYACWWYKRVPRVRRYGPRVDPLNRSTSPISNILEDLDEWAVEKFTSEIVMSGAQEEMERRVAALEEKFRRQRRSSISQAAHSEVRGVHRSSDGLLDAARTGADSGGLA